MDDDDSPSPDGVLGLCAVMSGFRRRLSDDDVPLTAEERMVLREFLNDLEAFFVKCAPMLSVDFRE